MKKIGLERLMELQKLIASFQAVKRIVYVPGGDHENDIEHSYALALSAWYLAQDKPELDADKVVRYALVHDLVEVHAGDTSAFASPADRADKHSRETAALEQLAEEWPDFPQLVEWIRAYEARQDPESVFVHALDKILPIILNYQDGGRVWHEHGITLEQLRENKLESTKNSPEISGYLQDLLKLLEDDRGRLFPG